MEAFHRPMFVYSCGRPSPIWGPAESHIHRSGKPASDRIGTLSAPKSLPKEHQLNRETPKTVIPNPALNATPTGRLEALSVPKTREETMHRDAMWPVPNSAKKASPTVRIQELSKSRSIPEGYQPHRDVIWQVPRSARKAVATNRLNELSCPTVRPCMDNVQYDPHAFKVKPEALKAICTTRTEELAKPQDK